MSTERCDCPYPDHPTADGRCAEPSIRSEDPDLVDCSECGCCMADCPDVHPEPASVRIVRGSMLVAAEHFAALPPEEQAVLRKQEAAGQVKIVPQAELRSAMSSGRGAACGGETDGPAMNPWPRQRPPEARELTAAEYAEMAQPYADHPPRRDEVIGPPWIAADIVATLPPEDQARLRERAAAGEVRIAPREEMAGRFRGDGAGDDPRLAGVFAESEEIYERELALERAGVEPPEPDPSTISMPNLADSEEFTVWLRRVEAERLRAAAAERGVPVSALVRAAVLRWLSGR